MLLVTHCLLFYNPQPIIVMIDKLYYSDCMGTTM